MEEFTVKSLNSAALSSPKDDVSMMIDGEGETNNSCPKLGSFYEFFSLAHLSPPLQCMCDSFYNFVIEFDFIVFRGYVKNMAEFDLMDEFLIICSYTEGFKADR